MKPPVPEAAVVADDKEVYHDRKIDYKCSRWRSGGFCTVSFCRVFNRGMSDHLQPMGKHDIRDGDGRTAFRISMRYFHPERSEILISISHKTCNIFDEQWRVLYEKI